MLETLKRKIKVLNERIWENRAPWPAVQTWLGNFSGQTTDKGTEQLHALYLLAQFMYFGARETRALLKAMFRDDYRYPIIESIRRRNHDTLDEALIETLFRRELQNTRFMGVGNPSESGTHLLYYFRQENHLSKELFINAHEIFAYNPDGSRTVSNPAIDRYVFLDDLCGSGQQVEARLTDTVKELRVLKPKAKIVYYVLFATTNALTTVRGTALFDEVNCVFDLDPSFKCFGSDSRYFSQKHTDIDKQKALTLCLHYGSRLCPGSPLGYRDCQLLIGLHHNTPDNTLPILWFDEPSVAWHAIFKRYPKGVSW